MSHIDRALRSNIKLRHLQLVVALDEFRHLGKTAEFLRVSQPAVSKMLSEVEEMMALQLFDRSRRGTEPTMAGIALVRFARSVLAGYEQTREEIRAYQQGISGRARVGVMVAAMPTVLAPAVEKLKQEAKEATVLIEEGDLTHLLPKLRLGELDLFVGRLEPGYAAPDLVTESLYDDSMVLVVRCGHDLAKRRQVSWDDVVKLRVVVPPPWASMRVKLEQQFFKHGLQPPVDVIETASFLVQITFVQDQDAVALMARSVAMHYEGKGLVSCLKIKLPVDVPPVGLIFMRGRPLTPISQKLVETMRSIAACQG